MDSIIDNELIPALFGCRVAPKVRKMIALPVKYGGMGIPVLADLATKEYSTSILMTRSIVENMRPGVILKGVSYG